MKKAIIYFVLLTAALLIPQRPVELGKLLPVEVVSLYMEEGMVVIETDTEDSGRGESVSDALADLNKTTAGVIFLDTADYLLVGSGVEHHIPDIAEYLKKEVLVCEADQTVDIKKAASFLAVHKPKLRLREWTEGSSIQRLKIVDSRLALEPQK